VTAEDYAPYGVGEPDADGWYPDYNIPDHLREAAPTASSPSPTSVRPVSWLWLVEHWRTIVADLPLHCGIDLYDPAVRARPFPGVRTMIFSLLDADTRLRREWIATTKG
jgi:hypothetical protein